MSEKESSIETLREQAPPSVSRDIGITVLFLLFAVVFLVLSEQFAGNRISQYDPGSSLWPRAALLVIVAAGLLNLLLLYKRAQKSGESVIPSFSSEVRTLTRKQREYILAIALSVVFFLSQNYIGFFVSAPVFLFAFSYAIGYRNLLKLTVFSLVTGLVVFFLFRNVVNIALPYGTGPFREISIWAANLF
ncbi:tripartite tricarboxylate transporter TctB family protein [Haloplanus natans]|uniref:tripartite tricarboxylate transporter TctB family protein n=1 Tax=Haloplanus natans TaxID=376171 RepID=UPI0006775BA2|nr:tripartite tricarboxylate transporter TctB family protein [Haloplanus natans]